MMGRVVKRYRLRYPDGGYCTTDRNDIFPMSSSDRFQAGFTLITQIDCVHLMVTQRSLFIRYFRCCSNQTDTIIMFRGENSHK